MNYYQHIPQTLGAAFYSPSEYLNKPNEFPIGAIRLINPTILQSQQIITQGGGGDRELADIANMPSPSSSNEYTEIEISNNKR